MVMFWLCFGLCLVIVWLGFGLCLVIIWFYFGLLKDGVDGKILRTIHADGSLSVYEKHIPKGLRFGVGCGSL